MKSKLLLLLLFVSSFTFAQNWEQVGGTQFSTNFVINAEFAFNNSGTPFVVYQVPSNNGIYVEKFNGTNWVQVGSGAISTENYNNLAIKINPVTNEPWVVLKSAASGSNSNLDIYSFDGSTWVDRGQNVGGGLYSYGIQLQFNTSGNPRISGIISAGLPNKRAVFYTKTNTGWSTIDGLKDREARIDFYGYNEYVMADSDGFIRKLDIDSSPQTVATFVNDGSAADYRNISGIKGTDYFATHKISGNSIRVGNGSNTIAQPIGTDAVTNGIIKFRESTTDNKCYLMFEETDNSIVFQKYDTALDTWHLLPNIGLSTTATDFFVKMETNVVDGNMYVLYKDGGRMSLKKMNIQTPLNLARIYVDADATGNADGSSWADAYTNLQDAIANLYANTTEIWIAEGTYKPHASDRTKSFTFSLDNLSIYGGFEGIETTLAERNLTANHNTILSGDLNGDDTVVNIAGTNRLDNSKTVVQIRANGITLNGLSINDGHAINGSSTLDINAAGIYIADATTSFTLKNCQINNNVARTAAGIRFYNTNNATIIIENCIINNNLGGYATLYFLVFAGNKTLDVTITNSLFTNNVSKNISASVLGYTGSATWIRAYTQGSSITTTINNCTFANNIDTGTSANTPERGPLALGRRTQDNSTHNATINNSIFYGNTGAGGVVTKSINKGFLLLPNTVYVNNSIGEDNFSNLTYLTNTSNTDPLFTDAANNDFTLQSTSPAVDAGDNSKIPAGITTDLVGNARIYNTTVDMGVYEFGASSTASIKDEIKDGFTMYPNPVNTILNIQLNEDNFKSAEIYNLLGRKVLVSTTTQVNVSQLSKGIYLIKVKNNQNQIATKRFIKN